MVPPCSPGLRCHWPRSALLRPPHRVHCIAQRAAHRVWGRHAVCCVEQARLGTTMSLLRMSCPAANLGPKPMPLICNCTGYAWALSDRRVLDPVQRPIPVRTGQRAGPGFGDTGVPPLVLHKRELSAPESAQPQKNGPVVLASLASSCPHTSPRKDAPQQAAPMSRHRSSHRTNGRRERSSRRPGPPCLCPTPGLQLLLLLLSLPPRCRPAAAVPPAAPPAVAAPPAAAAVAAAPAAPPPAPPPWEPRSARAAASCCPPPGWVGPGCWRWRRRPGRPRLHLCTAVQVRAVGVRVTVVGLWLTHTVSTAEGLHVGTHTKEVCMVASAYVADMPTSNPACNQTRRAAVEVRGCSLFGVPPDARQRERPGGGGRGRLIASEHRERIPRRCTLLACTAPLCCNRSAQRRGLRIRCGTDPRVNTSHGEVVGSPTTKQHHLRAHLARLPRAVTAACPPRPLPRRPGPRPWWPARRHPRAP